MDQRKEKKPEGKEHHHAREGLAEGIAFHRRHFGEKALPFWSAQEVLAWTLGDSAFVILSRKPAAKVESFALPRLKEGLYRDVYSGKETKVLPGGVLTLPVLDSMRGYAFELTES